MSFVSRANCFISELLGQRFPNASTLARATNCSTNTAQRTIYRVRDEYLVPFDYDPSAKGYFLTDPDYCPPALLPAGKDELVALLLARELISQLDAPDLQEQLGGLWSQLAKGNSRLAGELLPFADVFSSDSTAIGIMADGGLLEYVAAAQAGETLSLRYQSPWRHTEERSYEGRILRAHYSDGALYLLFLDGGGKQRVLNAAFVRGIEVLSRPPVQPSQAEPPATALNWLEGFGVWAGEDIREVTVRIAPPASRYYAAQRWNDQQEDTWDGEILVRKFPAMLSPELVRRLLSLGRHLIAVQPPELVERVWVEARALFQSLGSACADEKGVA